MQMTGNRHHSSAQGNRDAAGHRGEMVDMLLAQYVAGGLPRPIEALIGAHLEMHDRSRCFVGGLETLAGSALERLAPEPLTCRDEMLAAIVGSDDPGAGAEAGPGPQCPVMPRRLAEFTGYTAGTVPWRAKLPGFKECPLGEIDGCDARLYRLRPGRAIPRHRHEGVEFTLVLQGSFSDESGTYRRGDVAAADDSVEHRPVAGDEAPCICFAVTTGPTRLTGSLRQILADLIG